jgi:hypothetical protein
MEGRRPTKEEKKGFPWASLAMLHEFTKLSLEKGVLVRKTKNRTQLVLPSHYHNLVFHELHNKMGHLGPEKPEELARHRFYWPYMARDIEFYVQNVCQCVADKRPVGKKI